MAREASGKRVIYLHGACVLFPKLERELETHCIGDIVATRLLPEDAFAKSDPELLQEILLGELPPGDSIEVGGSISGHDEDGNEVTLYLFS